MVVLNGIKNFLEFLNNNWTIIVVIIGLAIAAFEKIKSYLSTTKEEKIAIAKAQIQETVLQLVTEAELEYEEWVSAGSIKRAQVIAEIYEEFPILSKITDQESLIAWIDEAIDNALETLRSILANNEVDESSSDDTTEDEDNTIGITDETTTEDLEETDETVEDTVSDEEDETVETEEA